MKPKFSNRITIRDLNSLIREKNGIKISLYINIEINSAESEKNIIKIKNRLKKARDFFQENGLSEIESQRLINPLEAYIETLMLTEKRERGLVIFLSPKRFEVYSLPTEVRDMTFIADRFITRGVLELFFESDDFYLLTLSENLIEFYRCSKANIEKILIPFVPKDLKEFLKYKEATIDVQFISQDSKRKGKKVARYFGHGAQKDAREPQLFDFLKKIDREIKGKIDEHYPLILSASAEIFGVYKRVSKLKNLSSDYVVGNYDRKSIKTVFSKAFAISEKIHKTRIDQAVDRYQFSKSKGLTETNIDNIVASSKIGKVDTLFFQKDKFFLSDAGMGVESMESLDDLVDEACYNTIRHGGMIFALQETFLPDEYPVSAILRK